MLLIAAVCMGCFTFLSLGQVQLANYTLNFTTLGFSYEGIGVNGAPTGYMMHTVLFFIVSLLSFILPLINIFTFKNLRLQKRVCLIETLFLVAVIAIGAMYGYSGIDGGTISWSSMVCAPFIALVADIMAYNYICSDDRKLKAADRLR